MSRCDRYGLPISTSSDEAAEGYREGIDLTLSAWPGAGAALERAIAADPDFALAHIARARVHAAYGQAEAARGEAANARRLAAARGTARERSHVEAIALTIEGLPARALEQAFAHLDGWPRDAPVLALLLGAYGLLAFSGRADHNQARVDACERVGRHYGDDWWFLTYFGWAHTENGNVRVGRQLTERALGMRRENANVAHALSHALFEEGASTEAEAFLADWLPIYDRTGALHGHLSWHQALLALEQNDAARALAIYQDRIRPEVTSAAPLVALPDIASLLWRLGLYGHAVSREAWDVASAFASRHFATVGLPFADVHVAFIAAATGDRAGIEERASELERRLEEGGLPQGPVAAVVCRAIASFADGDYARCARLLEPVRDQVVRLGGSHAQREVIEDMLLVALMKADEPAGARSLLDARLHRRPSPRDARWHATIAG
jgi:tetratricopeptide (TPR) repeat protein